MGERSPPPHQCGAVVELRGANALDAGLGEGGDNACPPPPLLSWSVNSLWAVASAVEAASWSDPAWLRRAALPLQEGTGDPFGACLATPPSSFTAASWSTQRLATPRISHEAAWESSRGCSVGLPAMRRGCQAAWQSCQVPFGAAQGRRVPPAGGGGVQLWSCAPWC